MRFELREDGDEVPSGVQESRFRQKLKIRTKKAGKECGGHGAREKKKISAGEEPKKKGQFKRRGGGSWMSVTAETVQGRLHRERRPKNYTQEGPVDSTIRGRRGGDGEPWQEKIMKWKLSQRHDRLGPRTWGRILLKSNIKSKNHLVGRKRERVGGDDGGLRRRRTL